MYQILPFRIMVIASAWLTLISVYLFNWGNANEGWNISIAKSISVVGILAVVITIKPIWRAIWKIPGVNKWFPDLSGTYDVELQHNWPIQARLLEAATGGAPFDPRKPDAVMPPLGVVNLKAKIDAGFYSVQVTMWSEKKTDESVVIERSRTLSTTLLRPCDGYPHRLIYTYQQVNQRQRIATTDDTVFEGSAILNIENIESGEIRGQYWTNRAWHKGLSTAGNIVFRRN
jgi:hypothetical protein